MNSTALVYPFDNRFLALYKNKLFPQNLDFQHFISPKGWGFNGKDIGSVVYGEPYGISIDDDFEKALSKSDSVLFFPPEKMLDIQQSVIPKIILALKNNKIVHCCIPLSDENMSLIKSYINGNFLYYDNTQLDIHLPVEDILNKRQLSKINTPIISIASITDNAGKHLIEASFVRYATDLGYKISTLSTTSFASFYGAHPTPSFLLGTKYSEIDKILLFNQYVKFIEHTEQPDIILMGIPDPLLPINENSTEGLGILAYEMTRAITPDISLMVLHHESYNIDHLKELVNLLNYRYGINIEALIVNNTMLDFSDGFLRKIFIDPKIVEQSELLLQEQLPVYGLSDMSSAFTRIFECLNSYSEVDLI